MNVNDAATIIAAVLGSVISGTVALFIWWRQHKSPSQQKRVRDAWQHQALKLADELRLVNNERIEYLEATIENLQRDLRQTREPRPRRRAGGADNE